MFNRLCTLIAALFIFSCASTKQTSRHSSGLFSQSTLTEQEISGFSGAPGSTTAYEVIRTLRPHFFYARGCKSEPAVFLNGVRMAGEQKLDRIAAATIALVRYYSPLEAELRFGPGNTCGVIAMTTK